MQAGQMWTDEEMEYLDENWGKLSIPSIANKLGRSICGVIIKKEELKLGPFLESGDYVTFNQLLYALGYDKSSSDYKLTSWGKNRNFPMRRKRVNECSFNVVHLDDWWKWAEKNKSFLDFSKFEEFALGKEPEWVKEKRKHDKKLKRYYKTTPWTKTEDKKLQWLIDQYKYSYSDVSRILRRTEGAIQRRCTDLNLKGRPLRKGPENKWTKEQEEMLNEFIDVGVSYEYMSTEIDKSVKAIRGKVYRLYGTESLDKARKEKHG